MKKLMEEYYPKIQEELNQTQDIEEIFSIIESHIKEIQYDTSDYMNSLTHSQKRVASEDLKLLSQILKSLSEQCNNDSSVEGDNDLNKKKTMNHFINQSKEKVPLAFAVAYLATGFNPLGGIAGGLFGAGVSAFDTLKNPSGNDNNLEQSNINQFVKAISLCWCHLYFKNIDEKVSILEQSNKELPTKSSEISLTDANDILQILQQLISFDLLDKEGKIPVHIKQTMRGIQQVLTRYQIIVQTYETNKNLEEMFEFLPSLDNDLDYQTVKPAFIKKDSKNIILRGEVIGPPY